MPDESGATILLGPRTRDTEGKKHRHIPRSDGERDLAWLPWSSHGCEHGLKLHKIAKNGYVYETGDRPTEPRRKPKAVSSRQWDPEA